MKLSELTAEQGLEAIANSLEHIGNIVDDDDALKLCQELVPREGEKYIKVFARGAKTAPKLLKTHKDDVIGILLHSFADRAGGVIVHTGVDVTFEGNPCGGLCTCKSDAGENGEKENLYVMLELHFICP